jgi:hypothetical protein
MDPIEIANEIFYLKMKQKEMNDAFDKLIAKNVALRQEIASKFKEIFGKEI